MQGFYFAETMVSRTYQFHFERLVFARHPNHAEQEIAFTDASITLTAVWDNQSHSWKTPKESNGAPAALQLDAPRAKRVKDGKITRLDAFHSGGKLNPVPIRLDSLIKRDWDDELKSDIRTSVVSAFWGELMSR